MLWPSRILTICTLCWCALCFVSLSLLWRLQRFGLMQGCFTKFYLPLLTMNWTTWLHLTLFSIPVLPWQSRQSQKIGSKYIVSSDEHPQEFCRFLLEEESPCLTMFLKFFLPLRQLLWVGNWVEHLKKFILLTDLSEVAGLSVGAHTTPGMKACVVHRTLENLSFFSASRHKTP